MVAENEGIANNSLNLLVSSESSWNDEPGQQVEEASLCLDISFFEALESHLHEDFDTMFRLAQRLTCLFPPCCSLSRDWSNDLVCA